MYIRNGVLVEKKPFFLTAFLLALLNILQLFFSTIFSTQPSSAQVRQYNDSRRRMGGSSNSSSSAPSSGAKPASGGDKVHSLPKPSVTGSCGGGG